MLLLAFRPLTVLLKPLHIALRVGLPLGLALIATCGAPSDPPAPPGAPSGGGEAAVFAPREERVEEFSSWLGEQPAQEDWELELERISTAVPWPRGVVLVDGRLVLLARGRHRRSGGIDPAINDRSGWLIAVDPSVSEPVEPGGVAGQAVATNAQLFMPPQETPFRLYNPVLGPPSDDGEMDRPYCTLEFDPVSRNFFICGYSGVDLPGGRFRKNATDSIHRYDLRNAAWHTVELHDDAGVAPDPARYVVANEHYPHHDPALNSVPHGWLNGPNAACVVGDLLYAAGKDNHRIVSYELGRIRDDPLASPPASRPVLDEWVRVRRGGELVELRAMGPSALAASGGHLYIGYRTSSIILRFPIDESGSLIEPAIGELVAVFDAWNPEQGDSANLVDIAFDSEGGMFVSCASAGRIWFVGVPDPTRPFDGLSGTANRPFVDLQADTGNPLARTGNITLDEADRLYVCSGNYTAGASLAGVLYRVVRR